jgi:hypothetical protein
MLSDNEKKVLLQLIDEASDLLSRRVCNDFDLSKCMPLDERRVLAREMHEQNGDLEVYDPESSYQIMSDWWLLSHLGKKALGDG